MIAARAPAAAYRYAAPPTLIRREPEKLLFQVSFVSDDERLALRAIQGHSIIDADPPLMSWDRIDHYDAPRL